MDSPAKVSSRSVRDIFLEHCDLNPDWPSEEHPSDFTHVNIWPEEGDDYIHIASIRHPYYRWLSYWKYGYSGQQHEIDRPFKWTNRMFTIYVTRLDKIYGIWNGIKHQNK